MRYLSRSLSLLLALMPALSVASVKEPWRPANAPLMKDGGGHTSSQNLEVDYPRPQMVRKGWINLNGLWDYAIQPQGEPAPRTYRGEILVPFPVKSALSGVWHSLKPEERLWYRRTFVAPNLRNGERLLLHFGALDCRARIFLNGKELGVHQGGYDSFSFDITSHLKPERMQILTMDLDVPMDSVGEAANRNPHPSQNEDQPIGMGICRTVWLEVVPATYISHLSITPDMDTKSLRLTVILSGRGPSNMKIVAVASSKGRIVCKREGSPAVPINLPIPNPHLWSPSDPYLYHLDVSLLKEGKSMDHVESYFAMRNVSCETDGKYPRIMLNGRFLFESGVTEQSLSPECDTEASTDSRIRDELETMKRLGFNLIQMRGRTLPERWYYWEDKLGILVWQAIPPAPIGGSEDEMTYESQLHRMILELGNHPCIILWTLPGKRVGSYDGKRIAGKIREWDPGRLVDAVNGGVDNGLGDVLDVHCASRPIGPPPSDARAVVVGKCETSTAASTLGAADNESIEDTVRNLCRMIRMARYCGEKYGLSAAVFMANRTLFDKLNLPSLGRRIREANLGPILPNNDKNTVIPTSEEYPSLWYYSFVRGSGYWIQPDFNEDMWKRGFGGFGEGYPEADTPWTSPDIWMRRWVDIPDDAPQSLAFRVWHTGDAEIYVNGAEAASVTGNSHGYVTVPINMSGRYALRAGRDLIAVHCHQTSGRRFIDVGIVANDN